MATAKKKPAPRKSTTSKAKAATPAAKKKTAAKKKPAAKKSTAHKVNTKSTHIPSGREQKLAEQALKFVDEAASVLRSGIRTGAENTAKSRIAAKKRASTLLDKASSNLSKAIDSGASTLQSLLGKI